MKFIVNENGFLYNKNILVYAYKVKAYAGEMIEPDEWDLAMMAEAKQENDGQTVSIEALASELGIIS